MRLTLPLCLFLASAAPAISLSRAAAEPETRLATAASPDVVTAIQQAVERTRERFEARDAGGILAYVSERYRSGGLTKAGVRQQLLALFALYEELRARVRVDRVEIVDDRVELYTTGEVSGRLPLVGWVSLFTWEREPEVARREGDFWRLFGFQD